MEKQIQCNLINFEEHEKQKVEIGQLKFIIRDIEAANKEL